MAALAGAKPKFRRVYYEIEKALDIYSVVILLGLRKTGKSEILKQLAQVKGGYYHDFKASKLSYEEAEELFELKEPLLLLDEVGYLDCFDLFMSSLLEKAAQARKKVVITSSSYGSMKQLGSEHLGGGRSYKAELFPLSFEEYLHFSREGFAYGDDYEPAEQDVEDFYRLINVPLGMDFVIDRQYMMDTFNDIEAARGNRYQDERDVVLTPLQYASVLDVIAYTLNDNISMKRLTGSRVGNQEFVTTKGLPMSQSLISLATKIVNKMAREIEDDIGIGDIAHIVAYLYHAGFLFVDLIVGNGQGRSSAHIMAELGAVKTYDQFKNFFTNYNFSVISPLIYTRLLVDLERIAGELYTNAGLRGCLYELAVKSESVCRKGYDLFHDSRKYKSPTVEIDLFERGLLFEATVRHKKDKEFWVDKVLEDHELIRVLTDMPGVWKDEGAFFRIGYPKALLMVSNGTIRSLEARKVPTDYSLHKQQI